MSSRGRWNPTGTLLEPYWNPLPTRLPPHADLWKGHVNMYGKSAWLGSVLAAPNAKLHLWNLVSVRGVSTGHRSNAIARIPSSCGNGMVTMW